MAKQVILVTGASSGIGKAIAERFLREGYCVYGTSRKAEFPTAVDSTQVNMIPLDVNDDDSVKQMVDYIMDQSCQLDVLVNCAGIGIAGAIEAVPIAECEKQMNVNFFGVVRVIQQCLPIFRRQKAGRIINIGSVAGYMSIPYQSMYSASKFALEAMTETLRMETAKFGIHVSLVEPGDTKTNFTSSRQMVGDPAIEPHYMPESRNAIQQMENDEQNGYSPDCVAKVVWKISQRRKPPVRVTVGFSYKMVYLLSKLLPSRLQLFILGKIYS